MVSRLGEFCGTNPGKFIGCWSPLCDLAGKDGLPGLFVDDQTRFVFQRRAWYFRLSFTAAERTARKARISNKVLHSGPAVRRLSVSVFFFQDKLFRM